MVVNVVLDLSPSAKYFAPSSPILLSQIDGCQCVVGLESFGQILRPFVANSITFKWMVVNVVLDLSPSAKYFAPSAPISLYSNGWLLTWCWT